MTTLLILFTSSGLLLAALSVPLILHKIGRNPWYGFRVKKTLEDPAVWYPVNAYAAKRLFVAGHRRQRRLAVPRARNGSPGLRVGVCRHRSRRFAGGCHAEFPLSSLLPEQRSTQTLKYRLQTRPHELWPHPVTVGWPRASGSEDAGEDVIEGGRLP